MIKTLTVLRPLLADVFGTEENDITPATAFEDLGADHEDMVEVSMIVEEEFDVLVEETILDDLQTVADLIAYIENHEED